MSDNLNSPNIYFVGEMIDKKRSFISSMKKHNYQCTKAVNELLNELFFTLGVAISLEEIHEAHVRHEFYYNARTQQVIDELILNFQIQELQRELEIDVFEN